MKTLFTKNDVEKFTKELSKRYTSMPSSGNIIVLDGNMGSGKTFFCSQLVKSFGGESVSSPSFALVQVYTPPQKTIVHFDFQRIEASEAKQIFEEYEQAYPNAIFVIEWIFEGWKEFFRNESIIYIEIQHHNEESREWEISYYNPFSCSVKKAYDLQKEYKTPFHVQAHIELVRKVAVYCAEKLIQQKIPVDKQMVEASAICHDAVRYVDFKSFSEEDLKRYRQPVTPEMVAFWQSVQKEYQTMGHEKAMSCILEKQGFSLTGQVVEAHRSKKIYEWREMSWEKRCMHYADKRAMHDQFVTIEERLADGAKRYGHPRNPIMEQELRMLEASLQTAGNWTEEDIQAALRTDIKYDTLPNGSLSS